MVQFVRRFPTLAPFLLLLLVAISFSGCFPRQPNVPTSYAVVPTKGLVVFSIVQDRKIHRADWNFKGKNVDFMGSFTMGSRDYWDWNDEYGRGRLIMIELPEGSYTITGWHINNVSSGSHDIEFHSRAGQVTYAGEVYLKSIKIFSYRIDINDAEGRDIPLLRQKLPNIRNQQIIRDLMKMHR